MEASEAGARHRLLYGRRRGRALRPGRRQLVESMLPALAVTLPDAGLVDPRALFAAPMTGYWLELGFGGGEHLATQAAAHPEIGMLGAEVFENGVAKLVTEIHRRALANIRLYVDDARLLVAALPQRCLGCVFILFPDPWPKERHKKRRLVSCDLLDRLAAAMADEAELRLATDDADYARDMRERLGGHAAFREIAIGRHEWLARPADWPPTRYEQKAIEAGRAPTYFRFARAARRATE